VIPARSLFRCYSGTDRSPPLWACGRWLAFADQVSYDAHIPRAQRPCLRTRWRPTPLGARPGTKGPGRAIPIGLNSCYPAGYLGMDKGRGLRRPQAAATPVFLHLRAARTKSRPNRICPKSSGPGGPGRLRPGWSCVGRPKTGQRPGKIGTHPPNFPRGDHEERAGTATTRTERVAAGNYLPGGLWASAIREDAGGGTPL